MNDERRKAIRLAISEMEQARERLETAQCDEQEAYDNLPESFQQGEQGAKALEAIDALQEATENLDTALEAAQTALGE